MLSEEIRKIANEILQNVIYTRRQIHMYPEIGFQEFKTAALIAERLKEVDYDVKTGVGQTGVVGLLKKNDNSRTIALRADMDALPITEENDVEYKSCNTGFMHACGHDAHTAILLGVAEILHILKDKINGNVKLIFQPGEEGYLGSKYMIEDGVLNNPRPEAIIATHVNPELECGRMAIASGHIYAASAKFTIVIKGKGGHIADPQRAVDPIQIGINLVNTLQSIITKEIDPFEKVLMGFAYFHGGTAHNVIPNEVVIKGTVRVFDQGLHGFVEKRMEEIIKGVTAAMRAAYSFTYEIGYPPLINDKQVTDEIIASGIKILGKENVNKYQQQSMGGEDFSFYLSEVPGAFFEIGTAWDLNNKVALHESRFNIDEKSMLTGMMVLSQWVIDRLCE